MFSKSKLAFVCLFVLTNYEVEIYIVWKYKEVISLPNPCLIYLMLVRCFGCFTNDKYLQENPKQLPNGFKLTQHYFKDC